MFYTSVWWENVENSKGEVVRVRRGAGPYVRPKEEGEVKGARNKRWAKRQKIARMKAEGHERGNNTKFEV